jgi:hypothetical protein
MTGLIGFAPVYLNGLLAIFFALVFPGLVFVRAFSIPGFPQRWFVIFLSSLTFNHLLVTLIAALHLDPLQTCRLAIVALIAVLILVEARARAGSAPPAGRSASIVLISDIRLLVLSLVVLGLAYFSVWKHGVPNIFDAGDVSVNWNTWSLIWSQGKFPTFSVGYAQFVPTIWALTYIFTASTEQYFAFYIYIFWIVVPIVLLMMSLGRLGWWQPLVPALALVWLIAEIRDPWLSSCLPQAYPDWVAAIFAFSGAVLFISSPDEGRYDREKITAALISLCLLSIAAATKPHYGLLPAAVCVKICADAAKYLRSHERTRLIIAAVGLLLVFAAAYIIYYLQLVIFRLPEQSLPAVAWERLSQAFNLFNSNFTLPFRILAGAGLVMSPFVARVRWLALPLIAGTLFWAGVVSYDLRNLIGILLISAFIPLFTLARALAPTMSFHSVRQWKVSDGAVAAGLAVLLVGMSLSLMKSDKELAQRFATEQLGKGAGLEINQKIEQLLVRGCTIFNADDYLYTISAFERFKDKMLPFHFEAPLTDGLVDQVNQASGCTSFFYPPDRTHPSIVNFISATATARNYTKVIEANGVALLVSSPGPR